MTIRATKEPHLLSRMPSREFILFLSAVASAFVFFAFIILQAFDCSALRMWLHLETTASAECSKLIIKRWFMRRAHYIDALCPARAAS